MAGQLYGVLREVVADETGAPVPARSALFTADFRPRGDGPDRRLLPALRVDTDDPAAGYLATLAAAHPDELVAVLRRAPERTVEVQLRLAQALIDAQQWEETAAAARRDRAPGPVGVARALVPRRRGARAAPARRRRREL